MSKKRSKAEESRVTNLKLICGAVLFILFIYSIIFVFHYIDEGGLEVLTNLKNS